MCHGQADAGRANCCRFSVFAKAAFTFQGGARLHGLENPAPFSGVEVEDEADWQRRHPVSWGRWSLLPQLLLKKGAVR